MHSQAAEKFLRGELIEEPLEPVEEVRTPEIISPEAGPVREFKVIIDDKPYKIRLQEFEAEPSVREEVLLAKEKTVSPEITVPKAKEVSLPDGEITSHMQGTIIRINVNVGDFVNEGDVLAVLEAMKMENDIVAIRSGAVSKIHVSVNQTVTKGTPLFLIS